MSIAAKTVIVRLVGLMTIAGAAVVAAGATNESLVRAQSPTPAAPVRVPDEPAGLDGIARTLIAAFDRFDVVALGEAHERKLDSDLRIAVVRHPDFAKKVRSIVVEFGSTTEQATLDRYMRGDNISPVQLAQVWRTTTQAANGFGESPVYREFFAAVRDVNSRLPADARIRVFGGDPGPGDNRPRDAAAVSVLKEQVLEKHGKALVIYGAAHFYKADPSRSGAGSGIVWLLDRAYPGRTFAVIPVGGPVELPPGVALRISPDYRKFDRALRTQRRPVLVSLERPPFKDFAAEEFIGGHVLTCGGPGGCRSIFQGSTLTLGQMADAVLYVGGADTEAKRAR
jgi:hypothetical protein